MTWLEARCRRPRPDRGLQILYSIDGGRRCPELTLDHLAATAARGRCGSATAPADQLQLDIYGELMDSVYLYNKYGEPISYDLWVALVPAAGLAGEALGGA